MRQKILGLSCSENCLTQQVIGAFVFGQTCRKSVASHLLDFTNSSLDLRTYIIAIVALAGVVDGVRLSPSREPNDNE